MGQGSDNFDKEVTKAAILREARRVYGPLASVEVRPSHARSGPPQVSVYSAHGNEMWISGRTAVEARRMALSALKAAGDAK